jgi:hypothetical protein
VFICINYINYRGRIKKRDKEKEKIKCADSIAIGQKSTSAEETPPKYGPLMGLLAPYRAVCR